MKRRTLLSHLVAWAFGALAVVWVGFVFIGLRTGIREADELTDGHLASTASLLLSQSSNDFVNTRDTRPPTKDLKRHDYQQSISVVIWDRKGLVISRTGDAPEPPFSVEEGFYTLRLGPNGEKWRAFARWDSSAYQRRLMVLINIGERDDLASDIAEQVAEPGFWLLPAVALALGLAIRRGLRPLLQLSDDVAALDIQSGEPLGQQQRHEEFRSMVESINSLIVRYQSALVRERQLASELAHEMRTPLASLTLHAQALRGNLTPQEREQSLARVASDSLRAGQVLQHLLSLARASHAELAESMVPVDLVALAARVLADNAQVALDTNHELSLSGSVSFVIPGHEVLLEIAIRNLLENALAHAPPGSVVDVEIDAETRHLQVTNALNAEAGCTPGCNAALPRLGLGLGHKVVDKVATIHGATFAEVPTADALRRYRITFASAPQG